MEWTPISEEELLSLIEAPLLGCDDGLVALFHEIEVPPRRCGIRRFGEVEYVFVVAEAGAGIIYYEDIEEGFEFCELGVDGVIPERGCDQLELCHILERIRSSKQLLPAVDAPAG